MRGYRAPRVGRGHRSGATVSAAAGGEMALRKRTCLESHGWPSIRHDQPRATPDRTERCSSVNLHLGLLELRCLAALSLQRGPDVY
jgi:hypothetical protein